MSVIAHWSAANQDRASTILDQYPERRSAIMPLMYLASLEHEYASEEAMREVAELTGITPAQVKSVVSFYTMFHGEPVGRYLVSVCTSISCHLTGGNEVFEAVKSTTGLDNGATDADGLFTIEHVECIGACGGAPAVQVNYELIEGVTPDKAEALIAWLRDGQPEVVLADEMQQLFGGRRSFDWGPTDPRGAIRPVPAFGPYGSAKEGR